VSTVRRAARNISTLFTAQLIARGSGILVTALVARHLGGENFGVYSLSISFASLFGVLAGLGVRQIVIRSIILEPEHELRTVGSALVMHIFQALATVITVIVVAKILGYEGTKFLGIVIMSITVAFMAYESLFYAVIEAHERMDVTAALVLFRQALWITLAIVAMATNEGYLVLLSTMLVTAAVITLSAGLVVWRDFCRFPISLHGPRSIWSCWIRCSTTWRLDGTEPVTDSYKHCFFSAGHSSLSFTRYSAGCSAMTPKNWVTPTSAPSR
jgi:O-antigen/teichoic acid export membrane protein